MKDLAIIVAAKNTRSGYRAVSLSFQAEASYVLGDIVAKALDTRDDSGTVTKDTVVHSIQHSLATDNRVKNTALSSGQCDDLHEVQTLLGGGIDCDVALIVWDGVSDIPPAARLTMYPARINRFRRSDPMVIGGGYHSGQAAEFVRALVSHPRPKA